MINDLRTLALHISGVDFRQVNGQTRPLFIVHRHGRSDSTLPQRFPSGCMRETASKSHG